MNDRLFYFLFDSIKALGIDTKESLDPNLQCSTGLEAEDRETQSVLLSQLQIMRLHKLSGLTRW